MNVFKTILLVTLLLLPNFSRAENVYEEKTRLLSQHLRCPICNGQSLWESQSPIAFDIQKLIYQKLSSGQSEKEVIDFLYERYGDAILMAPGVRKDTFFLWMFPILLLLGAGFAVYIFIKKQDKNSS